MGNKIQSSAVESLKRAGFREELDSLDARELEQPCPEAFLVPARGVRGLLGKALMTGWNTSLPQEIPPGEMVVQDLPGFP